MLQLKLPFKDDYRARAEKIARVCFERGHDGFIPMGMEWTVSHIERILREPGNWNFIRVRDNGYIGPAFGEEDEF